MRGDDDKVTDEADKDDEMIADEIDDDAMTVTIALSFESDEDDGAVVNPWMLMAMVPIW